MPLLWMVLFSHHCRNLVFLFTFVAWIVELLNLNSKHVCECAQWVISEQRILSYEYVNHYLLEGDYLMMESIVDPLKLLKGFRLWAKKG